MKHPQTLTCLPKWNHQHTPQTHTHTQHDTHVYQHCEVEHTEEIKTVCLLTDGVMNGEDYYSFFFLFFLSPSTHVCHKHSDLQTVMNSSTQWEEEGDASGLHRSPWSIILPLLSAGPGAEEGEDDVGVCVRVVPEKAQTLGFRSSPAFIKLPTDQRIILENVRKRLFVIRQRTSWRLEIPPSGQNPENIQFTFMSDGEKQQIDAERRRICAN